MKYAIYITTRILASDSKWYYRHGAFCLHEHKVSKEFEPKYFDTIESASSKIAELKSIGEPREIKIAEFINSKHVSDIK